MELSDEQKALILKSEEIADQQFDIFLEMAESTNQEDKLRLLETYHKMKLEEIDLLRQAGDPATEEKLLKEENSYQEYRTLYMSPPKPPKLESEFEAARLAFLRERNDQQRKEQEVRDMEWAANEFERITGKRPSDESMKKVALAAQKGGKNMEWAANEFKKLTD